MPLTLRGDGTGAAFLVNSTWWNDYYNLLTGVMTDQPVSLYYAPGSSGSTPTLKLRTNNNADLLQGFDGANTKVLSVDRFGKLTLIETANSGTFVNVVLPSVPSGDQVVYGAQVAGDSGNRVGVYVTTSGYGGIKVGQGAGSTAFLFGTASGWQTDSVFNVNNTLQADLIQTTGTLGPGNKVVDLQQSFGIYSDNVGGAFPGGTSRLWISADGANATQEVHIAPRSGSSRLAGFRVLTNNVIFDGNVAGVFKIQGSMTFSADAGKVTTDGNGALTISGDLTGPVGGGIPTTRNGVAVSARIFTGTNSPTSPRDGDIWIKA